MSPQRAGLKCVEACWTMPECSVCGLRKKPYGRDSMTSGYCDSDCEGYNQPPRPGHLWPDEAPPASEVGP
jgi:hypothetical protein